MSLTSNVDAAKKLVNSNVERVESRSELGINYISTSKVESGSELINFDFRRHVRWGFQRGQTARKIDVQTTPRNHNEAILGTGDHEYAGRGGAGRGGGAQLLLVVDSRRLRGRTNLESDKHAGKPGAFATEHCV